MTKFGAFFAVALAALPIPLAAQAESLHVASAAAPLTMDPHSSTDFITVNVLRNVYDTLVGVGPSLEPMPAIATGWEYIGDATWRFNIRTDVVFSDGTPLTGTDIAFSLNRQKLSAQYKPALGGIVEVKVIDADTIEIVTQQPDPMLPRNAMKAFIISEAWAVANNIVDVPQLGTQTTEAFSLRNANGSGAMKVTEQDPGVKTVLVRNDTYWGDFTGNVTEVTYSAIGSNPTRVSALLSGEVDIVTDLPFQDIPRVEGSETLKVATTPQTQAYGLRMDSIRDVPVNMWDKAGVPLQSNPFKDIRVRQAFAAGIDTKLIVDRVLNGNGRVLGIPTLPEFGGYQADLDVPYGYDPEAAKALLAEAGWPDGFAVRLTCPLARYPSTEEICRAVASMLARINVDVQVDAMAWPQYAQMVTSTVDTSFLVGSTGSTSWDAQDTFRRSFSTEPMPTGNFWSDPAFDELVKTLTTTMDDAERTALYREAFTTLRDQVAQVTLSQMVVAWGLKDAVDAAIRGDSAVVIKDVVVN